MGGAYYGKRFAKTALGQFICYCLALLFKILSHYLAPGDPVNDVTRKRRILSYLKSLSDETRSST